MMEGVLLTPPERTSLLGRTLWKSRWVTFRLEPDNPSPPPPPRPSPLNQHSVTVDALNGRSSSPPARPSPLNQHSVTVDALNGRAPSPARGGLKFSTPNRSLTDLPNGLRGESMWLSIYRSKGDDKPLGRFPIKSMRKCDVETMSYRKSSPAHPTLVVHFESPIRDDYPPKIPALEKREKKQKPDRPPKKLRPGRSSARKAAAAAEAAAIKPTSEDQSASQKSEASVASKTPSAPSGTTSSTKSCAPKTITEAIYFRSPTEGVDAILDWHDILRPHLLSVRRNSLFHNQFSFASKPTRPHSSHCQRPQLPRSQDSYLSTSSGQGGGRDSMLSPAASIRSSETGVSSAYCYSPKGTFHPYGEAAEASTENSTSAPVHVASPKPPFAPNPRDTIYSASVYSDQAPGSDRHSSLPPPVIPGPLNPTKPPTRETILDRAFQMNCIPGAESHHASLLSQAPSNSASNRENTMNSIARFEALMQEMDARKANEHRKSSHALPPSADPSKVSSAQLALDFLASGAGHSARFPKPATRTSRPSSMVLPSHTRHTSVFTLGPPGASPSGDDELLPRRSSSVSMAPSTASTLTSAHTMSSSMHLTTSLPRPRRPAPLTPAAAQDKRFSLSPADLSLPCPSSPTDVRSKRQSSLSFSSSKLIPSYYSTNHYFPPHNSTVTGVTTTGAGTGTGLGSIYGARESSVSSVSSLSSFGSVASDSESLEFGCSGDRATGSAQRWGRAHASLGGSGSGGGWRVSGGAFGV